MIEAWHTGTAPINRCVEPPAAYEALRELLNEQKSKREPRLNINTNMGESMADTHLAGPQPGPDEGTVVTTAVSSTRPTDEKADSRDSVNTITSVGRELRSMKVRTTIPDVD
nr:unnamed protein product [Spirometra erinaceieuropaei]